MINLWINFKKKTKNVNLAKISKSDRLFKPVQNNYFEIKSLSVILKKQIKREVYIKV
jgi:hypothetical protein